MIKFDIQGAIFDLDGTLLNSMDYWCIAPAVFLKNNGLEPHENVGREFLENGMAWCHENWTKTLGLTLDIDTMREQIYKIMEDHYRSDVCVKEGVFDMLDELKSKGVKMCLATATDRYIVAELIKRVGLDKYFNKIFTCSEVGKGKRFPLIYETALEYLGTPKEKTYIFEDAYYALVTAHKNGFNTVGVYDKNVFVPIEQILPLCTYFLDKDSKYKF